MLVRKNKNLKWLRQQAAKETAGSGSYGDAQGKLWVEEIFPNPVFRFYSKARGGTKLWPKKLRANKRFLIQKGLFEAKQDDWCILVHEVDLSFG